MPFFASGQAIVDFVRVRRGWQIDGGNDSELPPPDETDWRAVVLGLRDYVEKNRFPGVLLGLSGGGSLFLMFEDAGDDSVGGELFLGLGALWTPGADADFVVGGTPVTGEILGSGAAFLTDLGLRFGVAGRRFAFNVGFRLRWSGAFDAGGDVTSVIDPGGLLQYSFEFGWEYRL